MIFLWKPCVRVNLGVHLFKCTWEEIYFQQSFSRRNHYLNTFQSVTCYVTTQKKKFSTNYFFSQCDQIRKKLRIRSHLLKKSLMKNFIFCPVRSECLERILLWTMNNFRKLLHYLDTMKPPTSVPSSKPASWEKNNQLIDWIFLETKQLNSISVGPSNSSVIPYIKNSPQ